MAGTYTKVSSGNTRKSYNSTATHTKILVRNRVAEKNRVAEGDIIFKKNIFLDIGNEKLNMKAVCSFNFSDMKVKCIHLQDEPEFNTG